MGVGAWGGVQGVALLWWLHRDQTTPAWDSAVHLTLSLLYHRILEALPFPEDWLACLGLYHHYGYYPPLIHLAAIPFYRLLGMGEDAAVLANLLFLMLLLMGTYGLARHWWGPWGGLWSMALVSLYPLVGGLMRLYLTDFALTGVMAFALWTLWESRGFRRLGWSLLFGVSAGLGMLAKWTFLALLLPPLLWVGVKGGAWKERRAPFHILLAAMVALLVAGPWYLPALGNIVAAVLESNRTAALDGDPSALTLAGWLYYWKVLGQSQIFLPGLALLVGGVAMGWRKRAPNLDFLLAWWLGGTLLLTLVWNKDPRFSAPLLPAVAVLSGGLLSSPTWGRRVALAGLGWGLLQFSLLGFGVPRWPEVRLAGWPLLAKAAFLTHPPQSSSAPLPELVRRMDQLACKEYPVIGVLVNTPTLNLENLRYYACRERWKDLPFRIPVLRPLARSPHWREELERCDMVVLKTGDQGPAGHDRWIREAWDWLKEEPEEWRQRFEEVLRWPWPDGGQVLVFQRRE